MNVQCNHCGWIGDEGELSTIDSEGVTEYCPDCLRVDALMDLADIDTEK